MKSARMKSLRQIVVENSSIITFIFMIVLSVILSPNFFSSFNLINLARQCSIIALISAGMTLALLTGGIDLSVGALIAVASVFSASLTNGSLVAAFIVPVILTAILGSISGFIIARGRIQPFIVTLAMMLAGRGLALAYSHEAPIKAQTTNPIYFMLGRGYFFSIPVPVIVMVIVFILIWYLLTQTSTGRSIYAVGGNEQAARLMGVNIYRLKVLVYTISGLLAGLAGVILTSRLGAGMPNAGEGYELDAIAAAVIGGTLLTGGYGKIGGTLIGAFTIAMITNVLNLIGILSWYQWMIKGVIIIIAVMLQNKIAVSVIKKSEA